MRFERTIVFAPAVLTAAGLAVAGILSGCAASPPQRNGQLEQARIDVRSLEQDPDAQSPAQQQLAKANEERSRILLDARTQESQRAREQAQNAREETQRAQGELQKEQQELSELKTRQTQRGLELTLASDLLFNTGSAELKPGGTLQINRLADFMRGNPRTRVIIEGYTDSTGNAAHNEQLSQQRAQAVASALETQGVMMDHIQTVGRGQDYPVASNGSSAGRQQNRRVDIILSDPSGRFAQGATGGPVVR